MPETHFTEPTTSIWPILLALGMTLLVIGLLLSLIVSLVGVALMVFALGGWTQEVRTIAPFLEEPEEQEEEAHE